MNSSSFAKLDLGGENTQNIKVTCAEIDVPHGLLVALGVVDLCSNHPLDLSTAAATACVWDVHIMISPLTFNSSYWVEINYSSKDV